LTHDKPWFYLYIKLSITNDKLTNKKYSQETIQLQICSHT